MKKRTAAAPVWMPAGTMAVRNEVRETAITTRRRRAKTDARLKMSTSKTNCWPIPVNAEMIPAIDNTVTTMISHVSARSDDRL